MGERYFERRKISWHLPVPSTYPGFQVGPSRLLDRPPLERKSEVAITRAFNYSQAEDAVREAVNLLGGVDRICQKGDRVLIKPNLAMAGTPEIAETTHPAIVAALVRLLKETGATVTVGEKSGWSIPARVSYKRSGIREAALNAGADEVYNWDEGEWVEVDVPGGRSVAKVRIHQSVVEANVFIDAPKLKNNVFFGPSGLTLGLKSKLGCVPSEDRGHFHKEAVDMAWFCVDIAKALKDKHRLTLIDGISGVEGSTHYGHICKPGVIIASPDIVAAEAVTRAVVGYHPLDEPAVQVAMKDGLGTGDLSEINILGARLQDVIYPFMRPMSRYVQKYSNVIEYIGGGTCIGCIWMAMTVPPIVHPEKKYAVVAGRRVSIARPLDEFDEVWLIGECACRADHQDRGFMDKVNVAKKVVKMGSCPGIEAVLQKGNYEGIYATPMLLATDMLVCGALPETIRPDTFVEAEGRREGRITEL